MNLVVDPCPDARGFSTIRWADSEGSPHGDLTRQPVATAYDAEMARRLVQAWNEKHTAKQCSCQDLMGSPCCPVHG